MAGGGRELSPSLPAPAARSSCKAHTRLSEVELGRRAIGDGFHVYHIVQYTYRYVQSAGQQKTQDGMGEGRKVRVSKRRSIVCEGHTVK